MNHTEIFGNRMQLLRKRLDLRQIDLAEKIGIPKSTLAGYENGLRTPRLGIIEKLAEELHTSADYLIGITDDPTPTKMNKDLKKTLLHSGDFHIDGKKLTNKDLELIVQFLERMASNDEQAATKQTTKEDTRC